MSETSDEGYVAGADGEEDPATDAGSDDAGGGSDDAGGVAGTEAAGGSER